MSGRLFLGVVGPTASDVLGEPRRGLGSEEGLLPPSEDFSCLWKRNIAVKIDLFPGIKQQPCGWASYLPSFTTNMFTPARLLSLRHDAIMPLCSFQTFEDSQPGLQMS